MIKNSFDKNDFSLNLSKKKGYSKIFSKKIINNLVEIICSNIKKDNFNLKNIGTFYILNKNERLGRNPNTREVFKIKSRKKIKFKPSKKTIKILNE